MQTRQALSEAAIAKRNQIERLKEEIQAALPNRFEFYNEHMQRTLVRINNHISALQEHKDQQGQPSQGELKTSGSLAEEKWVAGRLERYLEYHTEIMDLVARVNGIADLNIPAQLKALNALANANDAEPPSTRQAIMDNSVFLDILILDKDSQEDIVDTHANQLPSLARRKLNELAPAHIQQAILNLDVNVPANLIILKELLNAADGTAFRRKLHEHRTHLGGIDLSLYLNNNAIIDAQALLRILATIETRVGIALHPAIIRQIQTTTLATPAEAKTLADLALARGDFNNIRAATRLNKQNLGLNEIPNKSITARHYFLPDDAKTDALSERASARLNDQIQEVLRDPNFGNGITLTTATEIKKITDLVIDDGTDLPRLRGKIAAIRGKLGVLNNLEEKIESPHVMSDGNAPLVQGAVRAKIQALVQTQSETAIAAAGADTFDQLTALARINDPQLIRNFIALDNNRARFGLANFSETALQSDLVINNPEAIHAAAQAQAAVLRSAAITSAGTAIAALNTNLPADILVLADIAAAADAPALRAKLIQHKPRLGAGFAAITDNASFEPFMGNLIAPLTLQARNLIQNYVQTSVSNAIQAFTIPPDGALLDTIANGNDQAIQDQIVAIKDRFGLNNLDAVNHLGAGKDFVIPQGPMTEGFKALAVARRIDQAPNARVVFSALEKVQRTLTAAAPAPLSKSYTDLKNILWNDPAAKAALLELASNAAIAGGDAGRGTDEARAEALAARLTPLFTNAAPTANAQATLTTALDNDLAAPLLLNVNIASAILRANTAEYQAQEVKKLHAELVREKDVVEQKRVEAAALVTSAQTAVNLLVAGTPLRVAKEQALQRAVTARDTLATLKTNLESAVTSVDAEVTEIREGRKAPDVVLATAQGLRAPLIARVAGIEAQVETARTASAEATAQPKAKNPGLMTISDEIKNAARGGAHNSNAVWELKSCERLKSLYADLYFIKHAAQNRANVHAQGKLDSGIEKTQLLIDRIEILKNSRHPGAAGHADTRLRMHTRNQLDTMKGEFQTLLAEMKHIKANPIARNAAERQVEVFAGSNKRYSLSEMAAIHKYDPTTFNTWHTAVRGYATTNYPAPLIRAHAGDAYEPQLAQSNAYATDLYRVNPPDPANIKPEDMLWYEHEFKQAGAEDSDFELTVIALPQSISDNGLFIKFLQQKLGAENIDARPGSPLHNLVFLNSPPDLDEKAALNLLKQISTGKHRDVTLAKDFVKYLKENQHETSAIHANYQDLRAGGASITRDEYLAKSSEERRDFAPEGASTYVTIPNKAFFEQADKILSVLIARGYVPITIDEAKSQPLLLALDCLAKAHGLREKIVFPNSYTTRASQDQIDLVKVKDYTVTAFKAADSAMANVTAAVTGNKNIIEGDKYIPPRPPGR